MKKLMRAKTKETREQIRELTEAIRNSSDLDEFLTRATKFLKEHCREISFILKKNGKIVQIKKFGRRNIVKNELNDIPKPPEKLISLEISSTPYVVLHTRPKKKTSLRKLRGIAEMISCGVQVTKERMKAKEDNLQKEIENSKLIKMTEQSFEVIKEITSSDNLDEIYFERISKKLSENFKAVNSGIVIDYIGVKVTFPESKSFEKLLTDLLSKMRETQNIEEIKREKLENEKLLLLPIRKEEKIIGVVGLRFESKPSDTLIQFAERCLNFLSQAIERREKISTREKFSMLNILNKLNTGVAFFSKSSPQKPIFSNEKFNEYIKEFPEIISSSESEIFSASAFNVSSLKEIKIAENNFSIATHPIYDGEEIMLEVIRQPGPSLSIDDITKDLNEMFSTTLEIYNRLTVPDLYRYALERLKGKTKIIISLFKDIEEDLSKVLGEIEETYKIEVEKNVSRDVKAPYNLCSGVLQLIIADVKISQKISKIRIEDRNESILVRIPYREEDRNTEEDVKFIVKYLKSLCRIETDRAKREIRIEFPF